MSGADCVPSELGLDHHHLRKMQANSPPDAGAEIGPAVVGAIDEQLGSVSLLLRCKRFMRHVGLRRRV
jgi:hypothetical protein